MERSLLRPLLHLLRTPLSPSIKPAFFPLQTRLEEFTVRGVTSSAVSSDLESSPSENGNNSTNLESASTIFEAEKEVVLRPPRVAPLPEDFVPVVVRDEDGGAASPQSSKEGGLPIPRFVTTRGKGDQQGTLGLAEAISLVKKNAGAKFDETLEAHVRLGIDPKRSDQMVRGAASLPRGTGKTVRVAVFAEGVAAQEAEAAGADIVGSDELLARIKESGGKLDFDKCISTPALMPKLGQVARILGPRGLMPNPKVGTVTNAVGEAVRAAKRGRVDFRADKSGIVHAGLGKVSFADSDLQENIAAFAAALLAAKPVNLKKSSKYAGYFSSFSLSSTMGSGVRVSIQSVAAAADSYVKKGAA